MVKIVTDSLSDVDCQLKVVPQIIFRAFTPSFVYNNGETPEL
jgi:hypothetical protein